MSRNAQAIHDAAPADFGSIPDHMKSQALKENLFVLDRSSLPAAEKKSRMCDLLIDYTKHSQFIDPVAMMKHLENVAGISLLICEPDRDPKDCATDLEAVLFLLGTSLDKVLTSENKFIIPLLHSEMVLGEDYQVIDGACMVSHWGMRKIARRLDTPPANVIYATMSACMDAMMAVSNYRTTRSQDRSKNLESFHEIEDLLREFEPRFEKSPQARSSNLLINLGKHLLQRMFGTGREGLAFATGISGTIRDAVGNHDFLSFDSTFRKKLLAKLQKATKNLDPDQLISMDTQKLIYREMMAYLTSFMEDWSSHKERALSFLIIRPLSHRTQVDKRPARGSAAGAGGKRELPLVVPSPSDSKRRRIGGP